MWLGYQAIQSYCNLKERCIMHAYLRIASKQLFVSKKRDGSDPYYKSFLFYELPSIIANGLLFKRSP